MTANQNRFTARFDRWDSNHDGRLHRDDLMGEACRVLGLFNVPVTSPKGLKLILGYESIWEYLSSRGAEIPLSREDFEQIGEVALNGGSDEWVAAIRPCMAAMVQLFDVYDDGELPREGFSKWLEGVGANIDTDDAFNRIDTDANGILTVDELCEAQMAYDEGTIDFSPLG